jgi:folate-binding protein YgfZ
MSDAFWVAVPRDVVRVSGPDALSYLQGQVSQDLLDLAVGDSRWTFLLQPAGKVEVLARVRRAGDDVFVFDVDAGYGEALVARLNRFRIRVKVDVEAVPWRVIAVRGVDGVDDIVGPDPQPPADVREGTLAELEQARVEAGWPAMGAEIRPGETIPAETGITDRAVNFTKGCYPGQELVERMDSRGAAAPRRLRVLKVPEGARPGDPIVHDGVEVGVLTSVAGTTAIGLVRRNVELGDEPGGDRLGSRD